MNQSLPEATSTGSPQRPSCNCAYRRRNEPSVPAGSSQLMTVMDPSPVVARFGKRAPAAAGVATVTGSPNQRPGCVVACGAGVGAGLLQPVSRASAKAPVAIQKMFLIAGFWH